MFDPVMVAASGDPLIADEAVARLCDLLFSASAPRHAESAGGGAAPRRTGGGGPGGGRGPGGAAHAARRPRRPPQGRSRDGPGKRRFPAGAGGGTLVHRGAHRDAIRTAPAARFLGDRRRACQGGGAEAAVAAAKAFVTAAIAVRQAGGEPGAGAGAPFPQALASQLIAARAIARRRQNPDPHQPG